MPLGKRFVTTSFEGAGAGFGRGFSGVGFWGQSSYLAVIAHASRCGIIFRSRLWQDDGGELVLGNQTL